MKKILLVTVSSRLGGAEQIIAHLAKIHSPVKELSLGLLDTRYRGGLLELWQGPVVGIWSILFGRYDLIHTHLFLPGLIVRIRRLWDGNFRWLHTIHYADYRGLRFGALKAFLDQEIIYPKVDRLIAVSEATLQAQKSLPSLQKIDNGVNLQHRNTGLSPFTGTFVLGTVSMLREEKGLVDLISVVEKIIEQNPQVKLKIAGEGPLRKQLEQMIHARGLQSSIEILGYVSDLQKFYQSIDIYVQPSLSESFGLALLQTFQYGKPIVAARVGNIPVILKEDSFGKLVDRDQNFINKCAEAIMEVSQHRQRYEKMSLAGLQYWQARLSVNKMSSEYEKVYDSLLLPAICMVAPIVTQATGGLQKQLYLQSKELVRRGHQVFILQRFDPKIDAKWQHVQFWMSPNLFAQGKSSIFIRLQGIVFVLFGLGILIKNRNRYDVIHAHQLYSPAIIGALIKKMFNKRLVVKVTASGTLGEVKALRKLPFFKLRCWLFKSIDKVIVLTPEMREEVLTLGFEKEKLELIPNGVATEDLVNNKCQGDEKNFRILYCGRLSTEKRLDTLFGAVKILSSLGYKVQLDLVGESFAGRDAKPALIQMAEPMKDKVQIYFHGYQKDVGPFYKNADAFVLASESEGLSNALLEALAYGVPCVASDIEPNRFLITHKVNGLLFAMGNSQHLSEQLRVLIEDKINHQGKLRIQLVEAAQKTIQRSFSTEAIGQRLSSLYEGLCQAT